MNVVSPSNLLDSKKLTWKALFDRFFVNDVAITLLLGSLYFIYQVMDSESGKELLASSVFLLNYAFAISIINYWLLPKFFNARKWWLFILLTAATLLLVVFLEEEVIEKVFYPNDRGGDPLNLDSIEHVLSDFLPIAFFFFGFKLLWDYQQKQTRMQALNQEKMESELKFLRSQLNPHVLFNNLNNIYSYALDASPKAPEMILKLSDIMRYMLYECDGAFVPLQKEMAYLKNYIELQKIQMEGRGKVSFKVVGETEGYRIAPLLLIAFVENSFKHSMQTQIKEIKIDITIRIVNGHFDFFAENTYSQNAELSELPGGIGLENVQKRLELIYPNQHELHFEQSENLFWINLRIELV